MLMGLALVTACNEGPIPTEVTAPPLAAKPSCPGHPSCGDDGGGDGDDGGTSSTVSVAITTSVAGAGIYPNSSTAVYPGTFNSDGDLWVEAPCDQALYFRLDLTNQGLGDPFDDQILEQCGFPPRLIIARLLHVTATTPTLLTSNWSEGNTNLGDAHNYYFEAGGTSHNLIWRGGLYAQVNDNGDGTVTYTVSAEPDLADDADLWKRASSGKPRLVKVGDAVGHVELAVTVSNE